MTKPEPLKGKGIDKCELPFVGKVFTDDDVHSAVEFLKENLKLNKQTLEMHKNPWIRYNIVMALIDRAFEDVME